MNTGRPSFRDPSGFCWSSQGRVFRWVAPAEVDGFDAFLASPLALRWMKEGCLVSTRKLEAGEEVALPAPAAGPGRVYEHARLPFPSYPHEWPPEMLYAAGLLTARLAAEALAEGYGLKDATPYNILFKGSRPVFVDWLSFEKRRATDPVWKPYAQFVRTFLLPLLAYQRWGLSPAALFTTHRDGIEPEMIYRWCGYWRRLQPPVLGWVSLPTWLGRCGERPDLYRERDLADPDRARFVLQLTLNRLPRALARVRPPQGGTSAWSGYMSSNSYDEAAFHQKESFVQQALTEARPARVLDVGANTGHFSALAAAAGASVVAVDADVPCMDDLWRRSHDQDLDILPLVVNMARPSPALGWRNRECASFLERARGGFDMVMMLAVLHHLLVSERIPLDEVLDLAAEMTTDYLLIEWVAPEDEMFRRIARGRDHLHAGLNTVAFETACRTRFEILRSIRIGGNHRWLYWLRKRAGAP